MADLPDRNDQRRTERRDAWRQHIAAERAPEATYQRIVSHGRNRGLSDDGWTRAATSSDSSLSKVAIDS